MTDVQLKPGQLIRVTQQVDRREGNWQSQTMGTVLEYRPEPTGSWHAHGKDDKLWLNRIRLRKPDGEITTIVIDQYTRVEILSDSPPR